MARANGHTVSAQDDDSNLPVPDPTRQTQAAVDALNERIRELYDLRFEQLDLRLEQRFQAQQKAIDAALIASDLKTGAISEKLDRNTEAILRLVSRDEYNIQHKALSDRTEAISLQSKDMITRAEYGTQHKALQDKLEEIREQLNIMIGRGSAVPTPEDQIAGLSRQIEQLRQERTQGQSQGSTVQEQIIRQQELQRQQEVDTRLQQRFDAQSKALDAALTAADQRTQALSDKIDQLRDVTATSGGRGQGLNQGWVYLIGVVSLIGALLGIFAALR